MDYNGYKLAENQADLTPAQSIFLSLQHVELYNQMNKVDK